MTQDTPHIPPETSAATAPDAGGTRAGSGRKEGEKSAFSAATAHESSKRVRRATGYGMMAMLLCWATDFIDIYVKMRGHVLRNGGENWEAKGRFEKAFKAFDLFVSRVLGPLDKYFNKSLNTFVKITHGGHDHGFEPGKSLAHSAGIAALSEIIGDSVAVIPVAAADKYAPKSMDWITRKLAVIADPIYEAMVRMAQDFSLRYPLIDGQGNFGSIDGDNAAAMRYTEARLTDVAMALMDAIDENAIDFKPTYDGLEEEPLVMPSAFPNLLANGDRKSVV